MRSCEARYFTGPRAGQPCDKPAKTWLAGNVQMAVCGVHRRGYVQIFEPLGSQRRRRMIKTTGFLVLKPEHDYAGKLRSVDIERLTKTKPSLKSTEVAIQLSIIVEERLFEQFLPEVEVTLNSSGKLVTPKVEIVNAEPEADAEDPNQ